LWRWLKVERFWIGSSKKKYSTDCDKKLVKQRINQAVKQELIDFYKDLLRVIIERAVVCLGAVTVYSFFKKVVRVTSREFPVFNHLEIKGEGVQFGPDEVIFSGFEEKLQHKDLRYLKRVF
jgi:hypothetical protein